MSSPPASPPPTHPTLDLAILARVNRGDRVEVGDIRDSTRELFERTLALVRKEAGTDPDAQLPPRPRPEGDQFVPENEDLRIFYLLAEAVGGYETFHDIMNVHSPGSTLSRRYRELADVRALRPGEVEKLRDYQGRINEALKNADRYLREVAIHELNHDELHELHEIILAASERSRELNRIMGAHLIHELEYAVQRLYEIHDKMQNVEKTISGIFLVDSEVMFIPANELIQIVNSMFEAVGNSYLARNVDGVLLLAARNLLIDVASFYSYYGKNQIYNVLTRRGGGAVDAKVVSARIRYEIRQLFEACQRDNKLVLTRIMKDAEREFEISADAIQSEAEAFAVQAVQLLVPPGGPAAPPPRRRGIFRRLLGWFRGR